MQTRDEYLAEAKEELGERTYADLHVGLDNDFYETIIVEAKQGTKISKKVYDSLTDGQRFHFNKHYNHRGTMVSP